MVTLVVAEKPSVARDIARVLGASTKKKGYLEGSGYRVTWAIGHLLELVEPHEMNPRWKAWRAESLPMLPEAWPTRPRKGAEDQARIVRRLLVRKDVERVVNAADAGREGELIFRRLVDDAPPRAPIDRLWISSLTDDAIRRGFARLAPSREFDGLAQAAEARARADWLVGLNLTRAYTLAAGETSTVGRVQTPTLAMVVAREREVRAFVPERYFEVHARVETEVGAFDGVFERDGKTREARRRFPGDGEDARALADALTGATGAIREVKRKTKRTPPPLLYDLTELQRRANRRYGLSAKRTLDAAQRLYEQHKAITYPRTESRYLSRDVAAELDLALRAMAKVLPEFAPPAGTPIPKRFVNDARVTDHHAIVPTGRAPRLSAGSDEAKVYDLVARRFLAAFADDHIVALTRVRAGFALDGEEVMLRGDGRSVEQLGFRAIEPEPKRKKDAAVLPGGLRVDMRAAVPSAEARQKETRPPPYYTEASLLTAMESAGEAVDEAEISDALRERGLGTPATRAQILEGLLTRELCERIGKQIRATARGEALIDAVHDAVKSPAMTGEWELSLRRVERGELSQRAFMEEVERYVRDVVGAALASGVAPRRERGARRGPDLGVRHTVTGAAGRERAAKRGGPERGARVPASATPSASPRAGGPVAPSPHAALRGTGSALTRGEPRAKPTASSVRRAPTDDIDAVLRDGFGFDAFRGAQREICEAVTAGHDTLVVMPTGAGKSLCYQLPGVARGGCTLVISPLIALIDDQVGKLRQLGFRAAGLHSGLGREASRAVARDYLAGELDFLFFAPERLGVERFPAMLAKRMPALVAVDEAHCISAWGHDFRPDYRRIHERLAPVAEVPRVALTATATPRVQRDIAERLGLRAPRTFVTGFARDNIAVEVCPVFVKDRAPHISAVLSARGRTPAVVYAPTRKDVVALAKALGRRAAGYHAGMTPSDRARVQDEFLTGRRQIIVATVAFGMGIDKADVRTVVHAALPATVEGYYQEIGRAGRDGAPSRAVLFFGERDLRLHEFFLDRDYPPVSVAEKLLARVDDASREPHELASASGVERALTERVLARLAALDVVRLEHGCVVRIGEDARWPERYEAQRAHRSAQIDAMRGFAKGDGCRMQALVRHFGEAAPGARCGHCDRCAPEGRIASPDAGGASPARATLPKKRGRGSRSRRASRPRVSTESLALEMDAPLGLVEALRTFRSERARRDRVKPYHILTNAQLGAIASEPPTTLDELAQLRGFGKKRLAKYGEAILRVLAENG